MLKINEEYSANAEAAQRKAIDKIGKKSDLNFLDKFGDIFHFQNVSCNGFEINVDCRAGNIHSTFYKKQYRFSRNENLIIPEKGDYVLDCGACFGDTALSFACDVGENGKIYAFEPLPSYLAVCTHNFKQNKMLNLAVIKPYAVGQLTSNLDIIYNENNRKVSPGFKVHGKEDLLPIISIDDFVKIENVAKVDFIKMDIEGFELEALKGAQNTIDEYNPKLAISLYHKNEDFITIPQHIAKYHPNYYMYLDHYSIHHEETVLYCKPKARKSS